MKHFLAAIILFASFAAHAANFPYIRLNNQTNRVSDNGSALTFNGVAVGTGGGGFVGAVSNSVASAGLLAVDSSKTNGITATEAHVTNALGRAISGTGPLLATSAGVLKAGDTMTGPLSVTGFTNSARTSSTFVVAAADKSDTSTATSSVLAATLTDETGGAGVAVFSANPTFTGGIIITNTATTDIGVKINGFSAQTNDLVNASNGGTNVFRVTNLGRVLGQDSTANTFPSFATTAYTNTGIGLLSATSISFFANGSSFASLNTGNFWLRTDVGSSLVLGTSADATLTRDAAATFQLGADAATATAQALKAHDGSGTDKVGANLTIEGGQSTGTAAGGAAIIRTSNSAGASASSANAYTERFHAIAKWVDLTESTATKIWTMPIPATNYVGLTATVTVYATDGTDHQSQTTVITVDGVAKTTTITTSISAVANTQAASAGTLTSTFTAVDDGSNVMSIKCNAVSSLSQTVLRAKVVVTAINSNGTAAITEL